MAMETDLQAWLLAQAGVATAIGDRLYRLIADQDAARPYAVMSTLNVEPQRTLGGPTGETVAKLQVTCWADEIADAESARDAIVAAVRSLERDIIRRRVSVTIGSTRIRDVTDDADQELYEDEIRQPRRLVEITVRYEE